MDESEFIGRADRTLARIGAALDAAADASDVDIDWTLHDGILTIDCGDRGKLIVNRHVPNREIWVAAKSGGFHFRADTTEHEGSWRDMRSGEDLSSALPRLLLQQAGVALDLPRLRAD